MNSRPRVLDYIKGLGKPGFGRGYSNCLYSSFLDLQLHAVSPVVPFPGIYYFLPFLVRYLCFHNLIHKYLLILTNKMKVYLGYEKTFLLNYFQEIS